MRNNGFFVFATCCLLVFSATSCQKIKGIFGKKKSSTTGWTYNDSKNGGIEYNNVKAQKTGPGLVFIPGGTFVMGRTQEDVMGDWNNTPKRVSIASFYMDETEVRNIDWLEYLTWLRRVYTTYPEVYQKALPDTLVWRDQLGYNEPMVKNYLRFPAYAEYPVVGVSWEQATDYCVWRTDRVNEQILIDKKILTHDPDNQKDENNFNTEAYTTGQYTGTVRKNYKGLSKERHAQQRPAVFHHANAGRLCAQRHGGREQFVWGYHRRHGFPIRRRLLYGDCGESDRAQNIAGTLAVLKGAHLYEEEN